MTTVAPPAIAIPTREVSPLTRMPADWDDVPDHGKVLRIIGEFTGAGRTISFTDLVAVQSLLRCFDSAFAPAKGLHVMASTRAVLADLEKLGMVSGNPSGYQITDAAGKSLGDVFPNVGLATILGAAGLL